MNSTLFNRSLLTGLLLVLSLTACDDESSGSRIAAIGTTTEPAPAVETVPVNSAPTAYVTGHGHVQVNSTLQLDGSASHDIDGDELGYTWRLTNRADETAAQLEDASTPVLSISVVAEGSYTVELVVSDGEFESTPYQFVFTAHREISNLDFKPLDAEFNRRNNTIVMVSDNPSQLHVHDPDSSATQSIDLPKTPTSVSISPSGNHAVVGHDALISYVDLVTPSLISSHTVSIEVGDIVLAGNDHAYAFPDSGQWVYIHSVNMQTGAETQNTGSVIRHGTRARLHPDGDAIYGADNGLIPSDIEKYSIDTGNAAYLYDSPYHGEYEFCGDLWFARDGLRVFTKCGVVVDSTTSQATDMLYRGSLPNVTKLASLDHSLVEQEVAVVLEHNDWDNTDDDTRVLTFNDGFLTEKDTMNLPMFVDNGETHSSHGRFVFYGSDGLTIYVVVQINESSGILNDYGIVSYERLL